MLIGMSQEKLGGALNLTFQQVQKYEKGANRIGAGRLFRIAQLLGVSIQFFFDDAPGDKEPHTAGFSEPDPAPLMMEFVNSPEGIQLNRYFALISDSSVRKRLVDLVKALAGQGDKPGP
ncbi:MAG: XRE family transcriptional regulator [Alphaproteobacteria bacterium]|nr:XRE family transcriptional regulator [Alphaproteobacteria bacterium]